MGMFDTVLVPCPECGKEAEFQSKSGDCSLEVVKLNDCPDDIIANVNRHAPVTCECGTQFKVDIEKRKSVNVLGTKDDKSELTFSFKVKNPKKDAITYDIETMQDIFDAVNIDTVDKFLDEFGVILRSVIIAKYATQQKNPESVKNMKFGKVTWTDD